MGAVGPPGWDKCRPQTPSGRDGLEWVSSDICREWARTHRQPNTGVRPALDRVLDRFRPQPRYGRWRPHWRPNSLGSGRPHARTAPAVVVDRLPVGVALTVA